MMAITFFQRGFTTLFTLIMLITLSACGGGGSGSAEETTIANSGIASSSIANSSANSFSSVITQSSASTQSVSIAESSQMIESSAITQSSASAESSAIAEGSPSVESSASSATSSSSASDISSVGQDFVDMPSSASSEQASSSSSEISSSASSDTFSSSAVSSAPNPDDDETSSDREGAVFYRGYLFFQETDTRPEHIYELGNDNIRICAGNFGNLTEALCSLVDEPQPVVQFNRKEDPTAAALAKTQIMFPPSGSITDAESVLVRGTTKAQSNQVTSVQVNGMEASTRDNYANWQVEVALAPGANELILVTLDELNNSETASANTVITRQAITVPDVILLDMAKHRTLEISASQQALVAVDLVSGERKTLSDATTPNGDNMFVAPTDMELINKGDQVFVEDGDDFIGVDLSTGERTKLYYVTDTFADLLYDSDIHCATIVDVNLKAPIVVDMITGHYVYFANPQVPLAQ